MALVSWIITRLNMFPAIDRVSTELSPRTTKMGRPGCDHNVECRIEYGACTQVHDENNPANTPLSCTTGVIALKPAGNDQGAFHFMSLATGRRMTQRSRTEIPISRNVIKVVKQKLKMTVSHLLMGPLNLNGQKVNQSMMMIKRVMTKMTITYGCPISNR